MEEQIRECAEERQYRVLNKVRCPEVWVFSSAGYSERAKEKIIERFKERTIQFFGPEDIVGFVDGYHSFFWFDLPHSLGDYLQALSRRIEALEDASSIGGLQGAEQVYIELDVFERIKVNYLNRNRPGKDVKNVNIFEEIKSSRISVLQAEMGFGKSKLLRRLALHFSSPESFRESKIVPVYSTFRTLVDSYGADVSRLIKESLGESIKILDDPEVRVVCLLDGLDEVNGGTRSADAFQMAMESVVDQRNVNILVATRPIKSLEDKVNLQKGVRQFWIRPLSINKLIKYLEVSCAQVSLPKRLYEDLKKSPLFRQLPQSPIAAALFSNLLSQNVQDVPQSLTELYSKSLELMLGRWDQKKQLATEKQFQTAELIAEGLAEYFLENHLIYMAEEEAVQRVKAYLDKRSTGLILEDIVAILFERSNIFSRDPDAGVVSFRHRSFAEFLCAKRKYRERNLDLNSAALDHYWTNVMFFYAGLRLDCSDLLIQVQNIEPRNELEEWMKILSVPNYLQAAYQTEFDVVENNCHLVLIDAAKLYLRVRSGETKTRLTELSEMRLLYLFKSIIVETLGYKFFEPAFDAVIINIQNSSVEDEIKNYALFFLGCASIDLGDDKVFKFMIEDIGPASLPLPVALAIRAETETHTNIEKSSLIKKHRSRLMAVLAPVDKRAQTKGLAQKQKLDELFDTPLKNRKLLPA